jgi:hypothetical protein
MSPTAAQEITMAVEPTTAELGGLLEAIQDRGGDGGTLLVRLRKNGGWEVRNPAHQPAVAVTQRDMDMALKALAIGSDLRREWQLALLFAEHREATLHHHAEATPARREFAAKRPPPGKRGKARACPPVTRRPGGGGC